MNGALLARVAELDARLARGLEEQSSTTRVVFGRGTLARIGALVDTLGARRVLILASSGRDAAVRTAAERLGDRVVGVDRSVAMHVPEAIAETALARARAVESDLVVAIGGGSSIGVAKAIALAGGPGYVAVPTTYSGSEMTSVWGITRDGVKQTGRDERVRARAVLYDLDLSSHIPPRVAVPSAMNALAHCMEALYAPDATAESSAEAEAGAGALMLGLQAIAVAPERADVRTPLLYGAWLAGASLGRTTMGVHHKLCHTLGGALGVPHAETHAVMLPHTAGFNAAAAPEAMRALARASAGMTAATEVPRALWQLLQRGSALAGTPTSLAGLGVRAEQLEQVAHAAMARPYGNPRPVTFDGVLGMLRDAHAGVAPA